MGVFLQPKQRQRCSLWLRREDGPTPHPTDILHGAAWAEVTPSKAEQWDGAVPPAVPVVCGTSSFQLNPLSILLRAQCDTGARQRGTLPLVWPCFQIPFPHGRATAPLSTHQKRGWGGLEDWKVLPA